MTGLKDGRGFEATSDGRTLYPRTSRTSRLKFNFCSKVVSGKQPNCVSAPCYGVAVAMGDGRCDEHHRRGTGTPSRTKTLSLFLSELTKVVFTSTESNLICNHGQG